MMQRVGVGRRSVAVLVGVVLLVGTGVGVVLLRKDEPAPVVVENAAARARSIELTDACISAARDKLDPLVVIATEPVAYNQIDGTDWDLRTKVNHKTKWADNWYDVKCVVAWTSPKVTVKSVETAARR